jgi:hypothetical protein
MYRPENNRRTDQQIPAGSQLINTPRSNTSAASPNSERTISISCALQMRKKSWLYKQTFTARTIPPMVQKRSIGYRRFIDLF